MWLMILGESNKPSMDQLMYYIYKTDEYMDEHDPNLNNTDILTTEGYQVPKLTKNYKVN